MTTPLAGRLARQIAAQGPITLADYMQACLLDPEHGYYTRAEVFGAAGDFVTAPEVSQMFGELLGLALVMAWRTQGAPGRFVLAELGPGRGTLMADLLRAAGRVAPDFRAAAQIVLLEASPRLRALQAERLGQEGVRWVDDMEAIPPGPLFFVANEFFDALPIRQFTRIGDVWTETLIGLARAGQGASGLAFQRGAPGPAPAGATHAEALPDGAVVELCPAAAAIAEALGRRIARHGGAGIVIDYGGWAGSGDTFQAVARHGFADPLAAPGHADLTAHVDFAALAAAAMRGGAATTGPVGQGVLLERLGIGARAAALGRNATDAGRSAIEAAMRRLTDPAEMGTLFKALAFHPLGTAPPPGFADDSASGAAT
jgi:NADH dehydrogenase [ubiquinone] 1 alpha subcomplex assembly factor 7